MRNVRKILDLFLILLLCMVFFYVFAFLSAGDGDLPSVEIDGESFYVEIADDIDEQKQGLMFRESLDEKSGMLFVYETPKALRFWMKNTLIPLDMVWISEDGIILDIQTAQPCKIEPCEVYSNDFSSKYLLELNAGCSENYGFFIGDRVEFNNISL